MTSCYFVIYCFLDSCNGLFNKKLNLVFCFFNYFDKRMNLLIQNVT